MESNWTKQYRLDIDIIDDQHQIFFELWDKEINQGDRQDPSQLSTVIEKLEDYLKNHIAYEEKLLQEASYDDIDNHIMQHRFFIQKVDSLKLEQNYSNPLLFEKTAVFMKKWFLNHIIHSDKKYKKTVTDHLNQ